MDDVEELKARVALGAEVDELVEASMRARLSLARTMDRVLPVIVERTGARALALRTYGEDMTLQTFSWPRELSHEGVARFFADNERHHDLSGELPSGDEVLVAQSLDVAGEWFGSAALVLDGARAGETRGAVALLATACEELDNYLFNIYAARRKQRVTMALSVALREPVLADGLARAMAILSDEVKLAKALLVVQAEDTPGAPVHVQVYDGPSLQKCTLTESDPEIDELARRYLATGDRALAEAIGLTVGREEVMIHGARGAAVGKLLVTARAGEFDTHDRDVLASFASYICQRVVDFNKEHRTLSRSFRHSDTARILQRADYVERYLAPREAEVAMLYVDISGFTRVSEQVLRDPRAIGHLVDVWGGRAVELVWRHGGAFDKMVGDCVIGLFGPPFFELDRRARVAAALDAALDIRRMTEALPDEPGFEALREGGLSVSTGVHLGPLFVGRFGPNENFTGFSAAMNNTARLQGQAARGQILVMQDAVDALLPGDFELGPQGSAKVKNVEEPLVFRPLVGRR
ncbi:MAG: adenylate/guanylate cyclase domain-containing protein [Polyangiaceae bacterium]|nr:adenylate/guanylate cyclase domain-containing protein [Polyangiaceae bacterium]